MNRGIRLKKIEDVRRFTARITNQLFRDEITTEKARGLGYLSNILTGIIKDSDIEDRITKLEKEMNDE